MANNVAATPGTGVTFKTTDTAGVHTGHVNVDSIAAGTNAIGKLAANSGVDIGDVDVTTVPADPFGVNADAASATGSISAKLRAVATALGTTALDLGSGTGGTRTIRTIIDSSQLAAARTTAGTMSAGYQLVGLATDLALPAGEAHLGEVGGKTVVKTITMTADTAIMAAADIIADTQQLDAALRKADGTGVLQSLTVFDPDESR